ncbi:unnamed protein product, partial [Soboliphyme baturini]|uniref:Saposin B-type domain-containing protein n=1 Tax=Soboliphyme baturini TaxID=241478 RepID=A0A183J8A8_9BILA
MNLSTASVYASFMLLAFFHVTSSMEVLVEPEVISVEEGKGMEEVMNKISNDPRLSCYICMDYLRRKANDSVVILEEGQLPLNATEVCGNLPDNLQCSTTNTDVVNVAYKPPQNFEELCRLYVVDSCKATQQSNIINAPFGIFACQLIKVLEQIRNLPTLAKAMSKEMKKSNLEN